MKQSKMTNIKRGNKNKIILDLCGGTGAWSRPYKEAVIRLTESEERSYKLDEEVCQEIFQFAESLVQTHVLINKLSGK